VLGFCEDARAGVVGEGGGRVREGTLGAGFGGERAVEGGEEGNFWESGGRALVGVVDGVGRRGQVRRHGGGVERGDDREGRESGDRWNETRDRNLGQVAFAETGLG